MQEPVRVTKKLQEVNTQHLLNGKSTETLCDECLAKQLALPTLLVKTEVMSNAHHTSCNRCGAIDQDTYAQRYS